MTKKNKPVDEMIPAEEKAGAKVPDPALPEEQQRKTSESDVTIDRKSVV